MDIQFKCPGCSRAKYQIDADGHHPLCPENPANKPKPVEVRPEYSVDAWIELEAAWQAVPESVAVPKGYGIAEWMQPLLNAVGAVLGKHAPQVNDKQEAHEPVTFHAAPGETVAVDPPEARLTPEAHGDMLAESDPAKPE